MRAVMIRASSLAQLSSSMNNENLIEIFQPAASTGTGSLELKVKIVLAAGCWLLAALNECLTGITKVSDNQRERGL